MVLTTSDIPVNTSTLATLNLVSLWQSTKAAFLRILGPLGDGKETPPLFLSVRRTVGLHLLASSVSLQGREQELQQAVCAGQGQQCAATLTLASPPSVRRMQTVATSTCDALSDGPAITILTEMEASNAELLSVESLARQVAAALGLNETVVCVAASTLTVSVRLEESFAGDGAALSQALSEALQHHELELPIDFVTSITYLQLHPPPPLAAAVPTACAVDAPRTSARV